ncbi:proton myo-inositol cotransporter [Elysia marginata]|uniref:Proton myo-inositol cotransporter n=1 Tax=Elysia marginata TaxID=1093978 RepID=A0AAV4I7T7_9GAST|nr:proton myo-inositol cotransporter [Elysia marginata]
MYLAECSPSYARGSLVSTNIAMVAFGQFMANVVDGIFGGDSKNGWRYMLGLGAVPAGIQFLGFLFMPESPRWLVSVGKEEKARRVLQSMRGALDIEEEYDHIKETCRELQLEEEARGLYLGLVIPVAFRDIIVLLGLSRAAKLSPGIRKLAAGCYPSSSSSMETRATQKTRASQHDLKKNSETEAAAMGQSRGKTPIIIQMLQIPSVRRSLLVGCSLQVIQQVAGINTVMYYSATIIRMSGVKSDEAAIWLSAVTAAVNFLFTLVGLYLVERIGRRPLTLASLMGAIVSLAWLAVGFHLSALNTPPIDVIESVAQTSNCARYRTCNACRQDLECGYCYVDMPEYVINSSCLPTTYDNPWTSTMGRCNSSSLPGQLTWAYDYCPTPYSWMPMVGLVLYLISFAPGE